MHNALSPPIEVARLAPGLAPIMFVFTPRLIADAPGSEHGVSAVRSDARANHTAVAAVAGVAVIICVGPIATVAIIAVVRKAGADACADRAKLHTGAAGISTDKDLRAGRDCRAEDGDCRNNKKNFFHVILQIRFGLSSGGSTRGVPALFVVYRD